MTRTPVVLRVAVCALLSTLTIPRLAHAADWPPLDPVEEALERPAIDRTADAEVLLWDIRVADERDGPSVKTVYEHYLRIKVFTERGCETQSKVDLTYTNHARVRDVEARVVVRGRITELRGQDVFDRTIVETTGVKLKAKSFVLPSVVPGSIIEYRWREIFDNSLSQNLELPFQRDLPVHLVRYHIKPLPLGDIGYTMRWQAFNISTVEMMAEKGTVLQGYTILQAKRMPAFRREPNMPPDLNVKSWVLIFYASRDKGDPPVDKFWTDFGKEEVDYYKDMWRVSGDIKTSATQALVAAGATTLDAKLDALLAEVRKRVKRTDLDTTPDALAVSRLPNKNAGDTLKKGIGDGEEVTMLFAAMAASIGLDVRLARMQNRGHAFSSAAMKLPYFFSELVVAVREETAWRFVDVSNPHAAHGHPRWEHEGMQALVMDAKTSTLVDIPNSTPNDSTRNRTATLRLAADGTLEGSVTLEYRGHLATVMRERDDDDTDAERKRAFEADMAKRIPGFEVSDYIVKDLDNPSQPYTISFAVRIPGYAQRAGSRLLFQPALIEHGRDAMFTAEQRWQQIDLRYAWTDQDHVTVSLPAGLQLDGLTTPAALTLDNGRTAKYEVKLSENGGTLTYSRTLQVGGARILFGPDSYQQLKAFFDAVHTADGHTVTLRRNDQ